MNKNFGKLRREKIIFAPNPLVMGDVVISNPTASQYKEAGYVPILYSVKPKTSKCLFKAYYVYHDNQIVEHWLEIKVPTTENSD